jgi:hypothetical protein
MALVIAAGALLFMGYGLFADHGARGAAPTRSVPGQQIHIPNPVPTDPPSLTPFNTPTSTPLGTPVICPPEFQDVPVGHPDYAFIHCVACRGSMDNFPCGQPGEPCVPPNNYPYFRPDTSYVGTRAEVCRLLVVALGIPVYIPPTPSFTDVSTCHPLYLYIETALHNNIISGYNCGGPGEPCPGIYFRPGNSMTRGQFIKALVVAAGWALLNPSTPTFNDVPIASAFYIHVETAYAHGVILGYNCGGPGEPCPGIYFRPGNTLSTNSRAEVARMLASAFPFCGAKPTPTGTVPTQVPTCLPTFTPTPTATGTPPTATSTRSNTPTSTTTSTPLGTPAICPPEFQDVPPNHPDHAYIHCVACQGSMDNFPCGQPGEPCVPPNNYPYFRPDTTYIGTRGEICRLITVAEGWVIDTTGGPHFRDVPTCHPLYAYIETAYNHGIISGYGCGAGCLEFLPDNTLTRGHFAKILFLALTQPFGAPTGRLLLTATPTASPTPCTIHFTDVFPSDFFYEAVRYLYCHGIMFGYPDNTFRPFDIINTMTRAEIAGIIARASTGCSPGAPVTPGPTCMPAATATPTITGTPPSLTPTRTGTITNTPTSTPLGTPAICPPEFQDVPVGHPEYAYIHCVACQGSMDNFPCGQPGEPCVPPNNYPYFRPSNSYVGTRGEICKLLAIASGLVAPGPNSNDISMLTATPTPCTITFIDVPPSHPLYRYVLAMYCHGTISGYGDNTFRPDNPMPRGLFARVLVLTAGLAIYTPPTPTFNDVPSTNAYYVFVETIYHDGLMPVYNCGGPGEPCPGLYFRPDNSLSTNTRADVAGMTARAFPYCGSQVTPTRTGTPTNTAIRTGTPTRTVTPTGTSVASGTQTNTPNATLTPAATAIPTYTPNIANTATLTATPCAMNFSDVNTTDYFYQPVLYLYCRHVISGYIDNTFRPYNNTTRGQLAKIVVLAQGWAIYSPAVPTFQDVPATDAFYTFIETAYHQGIISGYGCGTSCLEYRPGNNVTRGQLCKIVVLARGWPLYMPGTPTFQDVAANNPFFAYIETAYARNIISGYSCGTSCLEFRPGSNATRGQISKIVYMAVTQILEPGTTKR